MESIVLDETWQDAAAEFLRGHVREDEIGSILWLGPACILVDDDQIVAIASCTDGGECFDVFEDGLQSIDDLIRLLIEQTSDQSISFEESPQEAYKVGTALAFGFQRRIGTTRYERSGASR